MMYNWNAVWMPYCDSAPFSGNNATVAEYKGYKGKSLHFRGHHILQATIASLLAAPCRREKQPTAPTEIIPIVPPYPLRVRWEGPAEVELVDSTDVVASKIGAMGSE
jgi:hypothetical protein